MKKYFEYPESITNIQEVVDKIEIYELIAAILPSYEVPEDFKIKENIVESFKQLFKEINL